MMKYFVFFVAGSLSLYVRLYAYDGAACKRYAENRNSTLPEKNKSYASTMWSVECNDNLKAFVFHSRFEGRDDGKVSLKTRQAFVLRQHKKMLPILCEGFQSEYWFADVVKTNFEDEVGRLFAEVSVNRIECR